MNCIFSILLERSFIEALDDSKYGTDYEMMLVKKVMGDYKSKVEVRPVEKSDQPIIVTFDLAYSQLIDLVSHNSCSLSKLLAALP